MSFLSFEKRKKIWENNGKKKICIYTRKDEMNLFARGCVGLIVKEMSNKCLLWWIIVLSGLCIGLNEYMSNHVATMLWCVCLCV